MTHKANGHVAVQSRRDDAKERMTVRGERTNAQQAVVLDGRPGNSTKERARLAKPAPDKAARKARRGKNSQKENSK